MVLLYKRALAQTPCYFADNPPPQQSQTRPTSTLIVPSASVPAQPYAVHAAAQPDQHDDVEPAAASDQQDSSSVTDPKKGTMF